MLANRMLSLVLMLAATSAAEPVRFKERCLKDVVSDVPQILASQDRKTGQFGKGIWIVTDQNLMLPLSAAWSYRHAANPYYHSPEILESIMSAGDALIADQDEIGKWEFRKKDGSKWGKIYMPWTYSRWVRAYSIIKDSMPAERRAKWEKALLLGFTGIAKEVAAAKITNIAAHHAMSLYFAGQIFQKPEWCSLGTAFLRRVADAQHVDGYWSENKGPVVNYGFVYVDALGTYAAVSKDAHILPVLRKTSVFHSYFTYPDGSDVETVDERNAYHAGLRLPNIGFSLSPEGRSYLARQIALSKGPLPSDVAASLLLWGEEGEGSAKDLTSSDFDFVLGSGDAAVRRRGPWFFVVSTMTSDVSQNRWMQDRQNFVSVYHSKLGLIVGGGNTKLQPSWSNFTSGDITLLKHRAGDENPKFIPPPALKHVPSAAKLLPGDAFGVRLNYGTLQGEVRLNVLGPDRLEYIVSGDPALTAHLTLLPRMGETAATASGKKVLIGDDPFVWTAADAGAWLEWRGARITMPQGSTLRWPLLPHNPYAKDGRAAVADGHAVLEMPVAEAQRKILISIK